MIESVNISLLKNNSQEMQPRISRGSILYVKIVLL